MDTETITAWKIQVKTYYDHQWRNQTLPLRGIIESDYPLANQTTKRLMQVLRMDLNLKRTLKRILICSYIATNNLHALSYSRDMHAYRNKKRMGKIYFSYKKVIAVIDTLIEEGYFHNIRHVYFGPNDERNRQTCCYPTEKLFKIFLEWEEQIFNRNMEFILPEFLSMVEVRKTKKDNEKKGELIWPGDYQTTRDVHVAHNKRKLIMPYNKAIQGCTLYRNEQRLNGFLKIIHTNGTTKSHGRLYTNDYGYQKLNGIERSEIIFNESQLFEWDYVSQHIQFLFNGELHLPCPEDFYHKVPGYIKSYVKKGILTSISAKTESKVSGVLTSSKDMYYKSGPKWGEINTKKIPLYVGEGAHAEATKMIDAIFSTYPMLRKFRNGDLSHRLTNLDSQLALNILMTLLDKEIVCLTMHDSFLVPIKFKNLLYETMTNEYQKMFGFKPMIAPTIKTGEKI